MQNSTQTFDLVILIGIIIVLILVLTTFVLWARKHRKGANLIAAGFSFIAPDPLFDKNLKIIQEVQNQDKESDDKSGDPPIT